MKKRISILLAVVLVIGAVCITGASATASNQSAAKNAVVSTATTKTTTTATKAAPPSVRVNDRLVSFPDTQPYIDGNSRTMIPVRFVSEALGADVSWDNNTQTAVISLNGTTVKVPVNSKIITVTKGDNTSTVTMDTQAVITDGRTCIPVRFVAEALGAYVGYSNYYNTVDICRETLTKDEVTRLRGYNYCLYGGSRYVTDENGKLAANTDPLLIGGKLFAPYAVNASFLNGSYGFDNAREFLLRYKYADGSPVTGSLTGVTWKDSDENQARLYMNEAVAHANQEWSGNGITASFRTDTSCLYQDDYYDGFHYSFRGILNLHVTDAATEDAKTILNNLGVSYQEGQSDYSVDFEVKVSCSSSTVVLTGGYLLSENQ
ncbi:MAG: stalk domain-containing protein [Eubacteriales bacterium]|nr:stalk domain-containing protein [Eubacteriales bacterium]